MARRVSALCGTFRVQASAWQLPARILAIPHPDTRVSLPRGFAAGPTDHYATLGVSRGASADALKKAYRMKALQVSERI
jgi:DnaJ-domain-containing protein 1